MASLILSTIAFFVAVFFINRYLDEQGLDRTMSRKLLVGTLATVISIGAGWVVDKVDGDADKPASNILSSNNAQNDNTTQALKLLSGLK